MVCAAYVIGTPFALVVFGDLRDHIGRRKVLAIGVGCAAVSTAGFLAARLKDLQAAGVITRAHPSRRRPT